MSDGDGSWPGRCVKGGRIRRAAPLVGLTARTAGEVMLARRHANRVSGEESDVYVRAVERYTELLGRSKGALMKMGQILSLVPAGTLAAEQFHPAWEATLAQLHNDAPPMPPGLARSVVERELGHRKMSEFADFDWQPLAAASIGQVHAAQLADGRAVAVKVQYPGVREAVLADLANTELLVTFLRLLTLMGGASQLQLSVDMRGTAREISQRFVEELDYRIEAANQAEFAGLYRGHPFIHVPEVIEEFSTARVLTQELCVGRSWQQALSAPQDLRDKWADALWRFVYGSHARFGLSNIDPQPGNYIFHDDGRVSFLDFGCVKRYSREQVGLMATIVRRAVSGDVLGTWEACVEAGFWSSADPVSPQEVFDWWREGFRYVWVEQPFTFTPEFAASLVDCRLSPGGQSGNALRFAKIAPEFSAWSRIEVALSAVLGALRPTNDWFAMFAEHHVGAEPCTARGRLDRTYFDLRAASGE